MTETETVFNWTIERLDTNPTLNGLENVVKKVHWRIHASDEINTVETFGHVSLIGVDQENFIEYSELTEEIVVSWVESTINSLAGEEKPTLDQIKQSLSGVLNSKRISENTPIPLPW